MIWVILVIFVVIVAICAILYARTNDDGWFYGAIIPGFISVVALLVGIFLIVSVGLGNLLSQKIELAESQNADIEQKIKTVVDNYMEHESDTFMALKPEETILAASIYPELQSNTLVQEQIKVYEANVRKITQMKEEQIDLSVQKWWLYFGE